MKITESRLAIIISIFALAVAGGQAWYSREANLFNKEQIMIDAASSDNPSVRVGAVSCWDDGITAIVLNWRVTIFNNSTQPVTIKKLESAASTPDGPNAYSVITPTGPLNPQFPVLIEAKSFKTFHVALLTRTSREFSLWFKENRGCSGKPIWPSADGSRAFDETGWQRHGMVGSMFTAVSGSGNKFFIQAVWQ